MTTAPPPASRSFGIAARQQRKTLRRFASSTASQPSSVQRSTGPSPKRRPLMPCAVTSTSSLSSRPNKLGDRVGVREVGLVAVDPDDVKPARASAAAVAVADAAGGAR